jgi:hypothetical protein
MIAIFIDNKLELYLKEIKYIVNYVCNVCGIEYRYIKKLSDLMPNDMLFCYSLIEPTKEELYYLAQDRVLFYSPAQVSLYHPEKLTAKTLEKQIHEFQAHEPIPILTEKPFDTPFNNIQSEDIFIGKFNFDFFGNIFFNLNLYQEKFINKKDELNRYPDSEYVFKSYSDYPYVNSLIWMFNSFLNEAIESSKHYIAQKEIWPNGEEFATAISHSITSVQKWKFKKICKSFLEDFANFFTLKWDVCFKSSLQKIKYIFTNIEPYWNFDELFEIEKKHKIKASYFFASETKDNNDVDYDFKDKDLVRMVHSIKSDNNEIGLLASYKSMKNDSHKKEVEKLNAKTNAPIVGVKQINNRFEKGLTSEFHQKAGFLYNASLGFNNSSGFKGGIAFPFNFYLGSQNPQVNAYSYRQIEFPIVFSDNHLKLTDLKNITYDKAVEILKKHIKYIKTLNGVLTLDFNQENFYDIPYDKSLYSYTLETLKQSNVWVGTFNEIAEWWKKRERVRFSPSNYGLNIFFADELDTITITIKGIKKIDYVKGPKHSIKGNRIIFKEVKENKIAHIHFDTNPIVEEAPKAE